MMRTSTGIISRSCPNNTITIHVLYTSTKQYNIIQIQSRYNIIQILYHLDTILFRHNIIQIQYHPGTILSRYNINYMQYHLDTIKSLDAISFRYDIIIVCKLYHNNYILYICIIRVHRYRVQYLSTQKSVILSILKAFFTLDCASMKFIIYVVCLRNHEESCFLDPSDLYDRIYETAHIEVQ